jgi:hypothetical protein
VQKLVVIRHVEIWPGCHICIETKTPLAVNAKKNAGNLENAVDKVATDGSAGTEDGRVTQLLAEFLTVLLDLAGGFAFAVTHA